MNVRDLAEESFVSLTTYRRNGEGVPTPVWVARDETESGDALVVTTVEGSGKVERLRNDSRVTLRPCNRSGRVADDAPSVEGTAEVVTDTGRIADCTDPVRRKYGLQFKVVMGIERGLRLQAHPRRPADHRPRLRPVGRR